MSVVARAIPLKCTSLHSHWHYIASFISSAMAILLLLYSVAGVKPVSLVLSQCRWC